MRPPSIAGTSLVLVTLLAVTGCSGAGAGSNVTPGVTDTTVTIGSHQPLTGPASAGYSEIPQASKAFFDYVNDNGGIHGRKIDYRYVDDGYNPTRTVEVVKQLVLRDRVFAMFNGFGTPTHTKVLDFLNAQRVPDLFPASGCTCWNQPERYPYTFAWQPNYEAGGKITGQYIENELAGKKVGYFLQNDDFGKDGAKGLDRFLGDQVVSRQFYQPGNTDVGPQVAALQRDGAEVVVAFTTPAYTALLRLAMLKLGYSPKLVVSNVGSDPGTLVRLLDSYARKGGTELAANPLIQGIITNGYLPASDQADNTWIQLFKQIHDKYIPDVPFDNYVVYGMAVAYTFVQVLQAAGPNLTRESLVDAMERGNEFHGAALVPYRWSEDSHSGVEGIQMGVIEGVSVIPAGPPRLTGAGDTPVRTYDGEQRPAPETIPPPTS